MTARPYNFTKQNGVVMKARRRFTKQNGVVKQILRGWTKTNGSIEMVFDGFANVVEPIADTGLLYYVDANNLVADYEGHGGTVRVQQDYLAGGTATQLGFGQAGFGFNYANGVSSNQSLLALASRKYQELLLNNLYNPIEYYNFSVGTLYAPIKIGLGQYVGVKRTYNGYDYDMNLVYCSATGTVQGQQFGNATAVSGSLTLYDGRGVFVGRQVSSGPIIKITIYDYDDTDPNKITDTTLFSDSATTGTAGSIYNNSIFTPNGQDCIFGVNFYKSGSVQYFKLCKYNIQTKTVVTTELGYGRHIVGTYNGYIYIVAETNDPDELFVVEKYDLSLTFLESHTIPLLSGEYKFAGYFYPTIHSGGRYVAASYTGTNGAEQLLVLDLSLF